MEQPPLQSPAVQQAHDKVRGYAFQCWLTADAWLRLQGEDRLYVECAEDFAVFSRTKVDITQAKALAAPLSLRSGDVIEAINHLWEFQQQGYPGKIHFSFLTTAEISVEKGDHFGGIGGLALWQKTAVDHDEKNAEQLRQFLATDKSIGEKIAPNVLAYLQSTSAKDFIDKLLVPLVWDMGHGNESGVREAVEGRLAVMAEKEFGQSPMNAGNMADTLFTEAITVASSKQKVALTRGGLLAKMKAHLLPQAMAVFAARQQEMFSSFIAAGSGIEPQWISSDSLAPIQPAADFSPRIETIANIQKKSGSCPFVIFTGSSGMGKTTLAQFYSATCGGAWLQFRAKDDLVRALRVVQSCMALIDRGVNLIIDDLPWEKLDAVSLTVLRGMAFLVRRSRTRVLFTNQRPPSARELAAAEMSDAYVMTAPPLSSEEIADVATRLGCADKALAYAWSTLVAAQTSGHPLLVHAQLIGLKARRWPKFSVAELDATSKDVQDERARRQILLADLNPAEAEILQRLTVFFGPFRRDHALDISQRLTPIVNAGAAFERLRGPWIEPVTKDYFQLSPLIGKTLLDGLSAARSSAIHIAAVESVVSCQPVYMDDAGSVLLNAIQGGDYINAPGIIQKLMMAPIEHATAVRHSLIWAMYFKTDGSPVFPGWPWVDFLFRLLQFDVASELAPKRCPEFLSHCDTIIAQSKKPGSADGLCCLLAITLVRVETPVVPIMRLFWCAKVLKAEAKNIKDEVRKPNQFIPSSLRTDSWEEQAELFVATRILQHEGGLERLTELIEVLDSASVEDRTLYLRIFDRYKTGVLMAFDRSWLAEEKKPARSWEPLLILYERYREKALEWNNELFGTAAVRSLAIIRHEYLGDPTTALAVLGSLKPADQELAAVLDEQKGNIALVAKQYEVAQKYFESGIAHDCWAGFTMSHVVNCHQKAGTAAGFIPNWSASAAHFYEGSKKARAEDDYVRAFGMLADSAYALWQNGEKATVVIRLAEALELAPQLPDPASDLAALRALKCFGHLVHQLAWVRFGRIDAGVVIPGMCSDSRSNKELRDLPPPDVSFFWLLVLWLELDYLPSERYWENVSDALRKDSRPVLHHFFLELESRRLLRSGDFEGVVRCALEMAATFAFLRAIKVERPLEVVASVEELSAQPFGFLDPFPIPLMLLPALSLAVIRRQDVSTILAAWRNTIVGSRVEKDFANWIDEISAIFSGTTPEAFIGALNASNPWQHWAYALRILQEEKCPPEPLLAATLFFAVMSWTPAKFGWLVEMVAAVDELCSRRWLLLCENRSAFRDPTLFIPDLKVVAVNPDGTLAHMAELALAAAPALSLKIPQTMRDEMKARVKSHNEKISKDR